MVRRKVNDWFLPINLVYRTEGILRKANVLANDWKIKSPDLIQQLMPK